MKVIIIGGVAGGATAAARIRRLDEKSEIIIFERSGHVSYANCGLPYYVGGIITDETDLTLQTPRSLWERFRIDVRVRNEVTRIVPDQKSVEVKDLETGKVFIESYDKLVISTGAKPTKPHVPGLDIDRVFTLRTVEDTFKIYQFVKNNNPKTAIVAGGGFIGLEIAENLIERGLGVTVVQRPKQLMNPFDEDMAAFIHIEMQRHGVNLALGRSVEGFEKTGSGVDVLLKDNERLNADMVILAIGVTPDTHLSKDAGLELGLKGSIIVNDRMETSDPDIYAVGDAVEVKHFITGEKALISLAGPANKQGRIAADNICGCDSRYKGSLGSSIIKVFDITAASTGIKEAVAKKAGIDYDKVYLSPTNHASYYPGSKMMFMKIIFEKKTYKILGAQIVGSDGVDKRIDVIATAIYSGLKATDLKDLDLAYAPPYSSAKDPVNMAGFIVDNIANGNIKQYFWHDVEKLSRDGSVVLLDTRTNREYNSGHIEGYINIPLDDLRDRMDEIDKEKPVYIICQSGLRSYIASRILSEFGYDCYNFAGGYRFYEIIMKEKRRYE